MTALALSMGAPFWFDALNKPNIVRASGPKPGSAPFLGRWKSGSGRLSGEQEREARVALKAPAPLAVRVPD